MLRRNTSGVRLDGAGQSWMGPRAGYAADPAWAEANYLVEV